MVELEQTATPSEAMRDAVVRDFRQLVCRPRGNAGNRQPAEIRGLR